MIVLSLSLSLWLQTPSPASVTESSSVLTLQDAIDTALSLGEDAQIAQKRFDIARAERRAAYARILPSLGASGAFVIRPQAVLFDGVVIQQQTALSASASLDTTLIDLGAIPGLSAAHRSENAQKFLSAEARRNIAFAVVDQFLLAQTTESLEVAAEKRLERARRVVEDTRVRKEAGLARQSELNRAQISLSQSKIAMAEAQAEVALAHLGLAKALGYATLPGINWVLELGSEPATIPVGEFGGRFDIQAAEQSLLAQRAGRRETWLRYLPVLGASLRFRADQETGFVGRGLDWNATLGLQWSLFEGGRRIFGLQEQRARIAEAELEVAKLIRMGGLDAEQARIRIERSAKAYEETLAQVDFGRAALQEIEELHRGGAATALERIDAANQAYLAEVEMTRQALALNAAHFELRRVLGYWPLRNDGHD